MTNSFPGRFPVRVPDRPPHVAGSPEGRPVLAAVARAHNAEWERLADTPTPSGWGSGGPLAGCRTLAEAQYRVGGDRSRGVVDTDDADRALAALVRMAAGDPLAARVVLQRLLGPLVSVARRRSRAGRPAAEVFDDLVAQAWIEIRTFPIDRRPRKIAANLVRDTEYRLFTRPARLKSGAEVVVAVDDTVAADIAGRTAMHPSPAAEALALLGAARAWGVPAAEVDLLRRLHLDDVRIEVVADELGVTTRTVRNRRTAAYAAVGRAA